MATKKKKKLVKKSTKKTAAKKPTTTSGPEQGHVEDPSTAGAASTEKPS